MQRQEADQLAAQAERHHQAGRSAEAERLYRAALAASPDHASSLHGLGCLAHAGGHPGLAIGLIGQAVAAAPDVASYTISLGLALLACGHAEEARAALHVAVLRDPGDPRGYRAQAQALSRLGRLDDAEASLRIAVRLDPGNAIGHLSLGGILAAKGESVAAVSAFAEAARLTPRDPLIWHALASAYGAAGVLSQAALAFRRVAELLPGDAAAQANLGTALFALDRLDEAKMVLLQAQGLAPDNAATLSSLGIVLMGLGESTEAERILASASELAPGMNAIAVNHGTALAALERRHDAETLFRTVLSRDALDGQARFNLATMLLARGEFVEGWAAFEARLGLIAPSQTSSNRLPKLPTWNGTSVTKGRVLIRAEQGLGDTIQFLRWVIPAAARSALVLELPVPLQRLVRNAGLFDAARVHLLEPGDASRAYLAEVVAEASLLSLPHLLQIPEPPAMTIEANAVTLPGAAAGRASGPLRVGLAWAGSASYRFDRQRSVRLEQLASLGGVAGVQFVSLQQGMPIECPAGMALSVPETPLGDLADTAALIASLDLVISVDTMIVHLAGALGKPVWLLDRFGGDWRWHAGFSNGRDWYPGLRRFVQPAPGEWEQVISCVVAALEELLRPS